MIELLKQLQANRGQYSNGVVLTDCLKNDKALRETVQTLAKAFLCKELGTCGNCFFDAYIELVHYPIEKAMEKIDCKYELRRGVLLQGATIKQNMTQVNITNELAEYHLKRNPECKDLFCVLPEDWESRVFGEKKTK